MKVPRFQYLLEFNYVGDVDSYSAPGLDSSGMETRYYEGCGREGPIRCIFLGEFHPIAGPKIACQFPEDYISKDLFDSISAYIIPKPQIQNCTMTINALGHKIVGYPIRIDSSRYERNVYLFNLCFVCDSWSKTVQYEPVVKKLGEHLTILEEETGFVSGGSNKLPTLLAHLLHDLNTHRKATLVEGDTVMHLKVLEVRKDPLPVDDHDVPVLVSSVGPPRPGRQRAPATSDSDEIQSQEHLDPDDDEPFEIDYDADWDLTTRQRISLVKMGLLDLCEKYYNTSNLYEVLQIGEKANEKEVKKAYHKLSLKVHPDRVPEDQKLEATEKFKVLGSIHSILTDKEKRAAYDLTKCVDDDESYISDDKNWNAYWTLVFKKITDEDIQAYEKKYMGSEEEKTDLKRAYLSGKGDMDYIVDHVPFARSENEETHRGILNEMIKNGEIPAYKAFTNESPDKRQKRLAKEKREAEELQKELDLCSRELMITLKKEDQQMDSANDQPAAKSKNGGKKSRGTRRKATAKSADKSSKRRK